MISISEAFSVDAMLIFTVLTPHYSKKVCSQSCFCVFLVIKGVNGFFWLSLFLDFAFVA